MKQTCVLALLTALVFFVACSETPDKVVSINPDELTAADQAKIGAALRQAIEANTIAFPSLDAAEHPEAEAYVQQLFMTVLRTEQVAHRYEYDWSITVLHDDDSRMAFFLPGGHFYIYTGLLKYLRSESELLGLIGHELYYADTDLLIERVRQELGGVLLGDILLGNEVPGLSQEVLRLPYLHFDEGSVLEADSFSVKLLCPFLYEPTGVKQVLMTASREEETPLWLELRNGSIESRIRYLDEQAASCGLPGVSNEENYRIFKESLP